MLCVREECVRGLLSCNSYSFATNRGQACMACPASSLPLCMNRRSRMRILVILDCPETARPTLESAGQLTSRLTGATIRVLHPHPARDPNYQSPDEGMPDTAARQRFTRMVTKRTRQIHQIYTDWACTAGHGSDMNWSEQVGDIRKVVAQAAMNSDLVVLARPRTGATGQALSGALYDARAAVVLAPMQHHATTGLNPVVAWHASPGLERAIESAWPLLEKAGKITVIIGEHRPGTQPDPQLVTTLRQKGVAVEVVHFTIMDTDIGTQILNHAIAAQGDLLIMGAYGRPHLVEWLFGGATMDILTQATIPLLTHH
ncbi:universal stress protein [Komagataeibacter medellinensis]|uniref:Universal stress protein n=2 Tax=Komagataeibacter medellinensis TaxID=1177712 RepID=A0ABQ6VWH3_9PROT|nr:universal stress protein [Komagataeibacter medellinensis]